MLSLPNSSLRINAGEPTLEVVTAMCWDAVTRVNASPQLFRYEGHPVLIQKGDDDTPHLQRIGVDLALHILARIARWYRVISDEGRDVYISILGQREKSRAIGWRRQTHLCPLFKQ